MEENRGYLLLLDSRRRGSLGRIGRKQDTAYSVEEREDGTIILTPYQPNVDQDRVSGIVMSTRDEAERVVSAMNDIISKYEHVTVGDLLELVGLPSVYVDHRWGWRDTISTEVIRQVRLGWTFEFPAVTQL